MAIDIVLSGDRRILWGLAVTVYSALESATTGLNIYVLATGFTDRDKQNLRASWNHSRCEKVEFLDIPDEKLKKFRSTKYLKSKSAYSRYFIASLPATVSRCVYLDTDLLVFKDLSAISSLDFGENIIAAVRDVSVRTRPSWPELRARLGLKSERSYFNSGFLMIDLDAWRREGIEDDLIRVSIEKFDQLDSQDQDALNIVFEDRTIFLDTSWNVSQYEKPKPISNSVIHLIGSIKPWHVRYRPKFKDIYFKEVIYDTFYGLLDRTAYQGLRPFRFSFLGMIIEHINANIPTSDMIIGKIRRTLAKQR